MSHTDAPTDFDLGIVGSDQVWHHWDAVLNSDGSVKKNLDEMILLDPTELPYYLSFLPRSNRTSYAASFGFTEFPQDDLAIHRQLLNEMHFISCREQSGCDLVKSVTGRDVPHVLDPTLLLVVSDWMELGGETSYEKSSIN